MCKIIRIGLVALYAFLIGFSFLLSLAISGVFISWWTLTIAMTAWLLTCWLSVYFISPIHLFFHGRLRPPIMEEEARLQGCLTEVLKSASCEKKFCLRIVEEKEEKILSFGHDTIAISASLLKELTDEELKGVMAHELGHLISRDTMVSWAFATAGRLPRTLRLSSHLLALLPMMALIYFIVQFFSTTGMFIVGAASIFVVTSILLDLVFTWLDLLLLRQREYNQDAFAHRLGYGRGLRDALVKLAQAGEQQVNAWFIFLHSRNPVIYHRIRRLEQLLAWRVAGSFEPPPAQ
ncbi:MAG TPA: M48 family metalloprotease [Puia sp.]|nr:M48 family metalloprotease [Puia sp.]